MKVTHSNLPKKKTKIADIADEFTLHLDHTEYTELMVALGKMSHATDILSGMFDKMSELVERELNLEQGYASRLPEYVARIERIREIRIG